MSVNAQLSTPGALAIGAAGVASVRNAVRERAAPWVMSLGILLAYLSFPTRNYYWDGIDFALAIENSQGLSSALIHPHHLLYNVFGYFIYHLFDLVGWHIRAVHALQIANAGVSALCAWLLCRFLRHTLRSAFSSYVLTLLFSFSATWWKYSTDADAYVPSMFFLLVCLNLVLVARKPNPLLVALAHAAGMCLHQLAVFFYPVIVLGLFLHNPQLSVRRRALLVLKYTAAASSLTLATNYYCFHQQTGAYDLAAFANWLTSYLHGTFGYSFSFNPQEIVFFTLRGNVRLFFEGRLNWLVGLVSLPVVALAGFLIIIISTLAWKAIRGLKTFALIVKSAPPLERGLRPATMICLLWACVYLTFLSFWYPYFTPYRLFYLPALILLLGVALTHYEILGSPARRRYAAMFVAAVTVSNFLFFIYPLSRVEKNPPLAMALEMNKLWPRGTVIYFASASADNELFKYFNPATTWQSFGPPGGASFEEELKRIYQRGGAAWIETSALDQLQASPDGSAWLAAHTGVRRRVELVEHAYRIRFVQIFPTAYDAGTQAVTTY